MLKIGTKVNPLLVCFYNVLYQRSKKKQKKQKEQRNKLMFVTEVLKGSKNSR